MKMTKPAQKRAYWGWAWWAPTVLVAVGVGGFHAWTSIQIRFNDYEMGEYRQKMDALNAEMRAVRVEMTQREDMDTVDFSAESLGFQKPRPEQIVRLAFNPEVYDPAAAPHVDATGRQDAETPDRTRPQRAIEVARTEPVAPRETGRMTIALEVEAVIDPVNAIVPAVGALAAPAEMDGSVEQMLGSF